MRKDKEYLQTYDLVLTTASPLFIGDGGMLPKKSYLLQPRTGVVTIFDEKKFFDLLLSHRLVDDFETYMMSSANNLYVFLTQQCHLTRQDWAPAIRYEIGVGSALDDAHSLRDIKTFLRNAAGEVYVPGSSVKGALRTALLCRMILEDEHPETRPPYDAVRFDRQLSERYLNTLRLNKRRPADMLNDVMRGVRISDSCPVSDENMILTMKQDARVDGTFAASRGIVCRESIRPGTEIRLKLTLDQGILHQAITKELLQSVIDGFDEYYWNTYLKKFYAPRDEAELDWRDSLIMGGGAGFFSKTLVYPYLGERQGLQKTMEMMQRKFRKHHHEKDERLGISPHTMEYTRYNRAYYPMGVCEVKIL